MRQKFGPPKETSERVVKDIRRATCKRYSAEEKIRIVLDGLCGKDTLFRTKPDQPAQDAASNVTRRRLTAPDSHS